jgi:hypothetical protein
MIIKEYQKEYKDYFMFITIHHSLIEVSMHSYIDDDFEYTNRFIDYSPKEVYKILCHYIDNHKEQAIA